MKLYIAGASADYLLCEHLAVEARLLGFEIVHEWWKDVHATRTIAGKSDRELDDATRFDLATKDHTAVQLAEVFWLVCSKPTTGAWYELGVAVTSGVFSIASGDHRACLFTSKCARRFDAHEGALKFLLSIIDEPQASSEVVR